MEVSDTCSWKSDICPHRVYNFTTTTEKSKVEGRQSRFLGLILGMEWYERDKQVPRCDEREEYGRYVRISTPSRGHLAR